MARVTELGVWLHDVHVATLTAPRVGTVRLEYLPDVRARYPLNTPLLSCSLPVRTGKQDAWPFATGLLPEGRHRQAMAELAGVPTHDLLGMLARFGRDVAGAVVVASNTGEPRTASFSPYTDDDLATAVDTLADHPLGLYDDSELSIAGLQDKMLLVRTSDGGWARPVHGYPSTHLLKVDDRRFPGLVDAEHICLRLAASAGLPAAHSELHTLGDNTCIAVTRFDRTTTPDGHVTRIHQEDTCQALGIDPDSNQRRAKYERYGGPSLAAIARKLEQWAEPDQLLGLLDQVVFTVVIGNADAHGKNISFLHRAPGALELAPLYDTVPTAIWATLRTEAGMRIGGRPLLADVTLADLVHEAGDWGLGEQIASTRLMATTQALAEAAPTLLGASEIADAALRAALERAQQLLGNT